MKLKDYTEYYIQWDAMQGCFFKSVDEYKLHHYFGTLFGYEIESFEKFLAHQPERSNLTLKTAKELYDQFLKNKTRPVSQQ